MRSPHPSTFFKASLFIFVGSSISERVIMPPMSNVIFPADIPALMPSSLGKVDKSLFTESMINGRQGRI